MQFRNVIKGQVTQSLLTTLLERAGYRVTRFGIEELFREVKHIGLQQYRSLNLPLHLRTLPDLLVAELDISEAYLVEVKFRKEFTEKSARSLHRELTNQRKYWPESYAVVMIANSFVPDGRFHQDFIRVVEPENEDWLVDNKWDVEQRWTGLPHIQHVFKKFFKSLDNQQNADLITTTLKELSKL